MPEQYTSVNSLDLFNSLYEERFVFKVNNVIYAFNIAGIAWLLGNKR